MTRVIAGSSDANIPFEQTRTLLRGMGFSERIVGSHHIFAREDVSERIYLRPTREGTLKRYQVRQLRGLLLRYRLDKEEDRWVKPPEEDRFEIDIFWSDEDDAYIAVVPDIPSCTAWGNTYEEALKVIRAAIQGNIPVAREFGHPVPQPKARQVS